MQKLRHKLLLTILAPALGAILLAAAVIGNAADSPQPTVDYNRDIRPILSDNCYACHGPDEKQRKAKLRFDVPSEALKPAKSGDYAIVPGDVAKSKLVERVASKDPDEIMPPPKSGKKLTAQQMELLRRWIQGGAKFVAHWAFVKPERPAVPAVKDVQWARN